MTGSKRRKAIAVFFFAQAALFGWGGVVTILFVVSGTGDPSLTNQLQLASEQAAGFAVCAVLAVFTLRGSRVALYATATISAVSSLIDLGVAGIELFWAGPLALLYLLFFPLPNVLLGAVAIPVLVLSLSLIRDHRRARSRPPGLPPPAEARDDPKDQSGVSTEQRVMSSRPLDEP